MLHMVSVRLKGSLYGVLQASRIGNSLCTEIFLGQNNTELH